MFALAGRHVLVVDASPEEGERLRDAFALEGVWCDVVSGVETAAERSRTIAFDLVVVALTAGSGGRACAILRRDARTPDVPVIALVDEDAESDAVGAVLHGADAYLFRPVRLRPLLASVMALLRRTRVPVRADAGPDPANGHGRGVRIGELDLDVARRVATLGGQPLALTDQQFRLLHLFMANPGRVFGRQALAERLCASRYVSSRAVDALVRRLRRQLRREGQGSQYVVTVRGRGYKLVDRAEAGSREGAA